MASTRLTKDIRETLRKEILQHAFKERVNAQIDAERAFATEIFEARYQKHLDMLATAPDGFFRHDHQFLVRFDDRTSASLSFYDGLGSNELFKEAGQENPAKFTRAMPWNAASNFVVETFADTAPESKKFNRLKDAHMELIHELRNMRASIVKALSAVTTVNKLIESWPEIESFAKKFLDDGTKKASVPAIPRDVLNASLDLPPSKAA